MKKPLLRIVAVVVLTLGFTAFVGAYALQSVETRLAQTFAEQQRINSLSAVTRLLDRYELAKLAAQTLAHELPATPGALGPDERLSSLTAALGRRQVAFYRYAPNQPRVPHWPAAAALPKAADLAALYADCGQYDRAVRFTRVGLSPPALLVGLRVAAAPREMLALTVDLVQTLEPTTGDGRPLGSVYVLELGRGERLPVLAATEPEAIGRDFGALYGGELLNRIRQRKLGAFWEARRLDQPNQPFYLTGVCGLDLGPGAPTVAIANTAPRWIMVQPYLRHVLRWVLLLGGVVLLSLGSFAALVGQAIYAGEQERRRTEERQALYRISQALQSASALEEVLQSITDQARGLFRTDGATIALLDDAQTELVFRCVSSGDPDTADRLMGTRLPRGQGVLGWAVEHCEALAVDDVAADPRFAAHHTHRFGQPTEALLCAPLLDQDGQAFGAIELISFSGEPFPASDLVLLRSLAATASAAVERAMLLEQEKVQERLQREMEIARTVQRSLLPQSAPQLAGLQFSGVSQPAYEVGGDFYDYLHIDDTHLGVAIADVADKGLGAAMFMVMCRSLLYNAASHDLSPAHVLGELNTRLVEIATSGMFVTLFYAIIDTRTRRVVCASAGHNAPLLHRASAGTLEPLPVRGVALGVLDNIKLTNYELQLEPGDRLVMYTDGVPDAIDADVQAFGMERFNAAILSASDSDADGTRDAILSAVMAYSAAERQFDDITLAIVRVLPEA